jgi:hypothetical protein
MRTVYCVKLKGGAETRWTERSSAARVDIVVLGSSEAYGKSAVSFADARRQVEIAELERIANN